MNEMLFISHEMLYISLNSSISCVNIRNELGINTNQVWQ